MIHPLSILLQLATSTDLLYNHTKIEFFFAFSLYFLYNIIFFLFLAKRILGKLNWLTHLANHLYNFFLRIY